MIQLALPSFLFSLLLLAILSSYILRRWERGVSLVNGAMLNLVGVLLWRYPLDSPLLTLPLLPVELDLREEIWQYGFRLQLTQTNESVVVIILLLLGSGMLLSAAASQGRVFPPSMLLVGAGYIGIALMVDAPISPVFLAPTVLAILMSISVFPLQVGIEGEALSSLRAMLPPILATPFVLLAAWNMEQLPLNPQDIRLAAGGAQLLGVGLLILLAPVPLHSGQPQLGESAPPIAMALTILLYQTLALYIYFLATTNFPLLLNSTALNVWLTSTATVTLVWGGVAAAAASHPGRLLGYAMVHDWGLILLLLAGSDEGSLPMVISLFALRILSAMSASAGLSQIRQAAGSLDAENLQGIGARLPWSTAAFLLGSLGLAGFPLTAGFSGHWSAIQALAEGDWRFAAIVLIASGSVIFGFVRMVGIFFGRLADPQLPRERPLGVVFSLMAILLVTGMAIAPQLFEGPLVRTLLAFD